MKIPALFAADIAPSGTPARKFQRGLLNIALSPMDISRELAKEKSRGTFPPGWFLGLGRGALFAVGRALAGVYELATFPLLLPADYSPVIEPEFAWEHLEKPQTIAHRP